MGFQHSSAPATKDAANFEQHLRAFFGQNTQIKSYGHHVHIRNYIRENKTALNAGWADFQMVTKVEDPLYELDKLMLLVESSNGSKEHVAEGTYGLSEFLNKKWLEEQRTAKLAAVGNGKTHHIIKLPNLGDARAFLKNAHGIDIPADSKLIVQDALLDAGSFKGVPAIAPSGSVKGGAGASTGGVGVMGAFGGGVDAAWDGV
jgi:hypothetical protein